MANIAQHEAAELWEISRDHQITAAKIEFLCNQVSDPQLRSNLEQHARRFRQAAHQLESFLQGGNSFNHARGNLGSGQSFQSTQQSSQGFQSTQGFQSGQGFQSAQGFQTNSFNPSQSFDALIVADCLKGCKDMAVQAIRGATEASQPARNFLYQLAGEHLQMAEQHYHWLEQHGLYASPKSDQQTIQQYAQALSQVAQVGQSAQQRSFSSTQSYPQFQSQQQYSGYGTGYTQTNQPTTAPFNNQSGQFSQPTYAGQSNPYNQ